MNKRTMQGTIVLAMAAMLMMQGCGQGDGDGAEGSRPGSRFSPFSRGPSPGTTTTVDLGAGVSLDLVWIPPGRFLMGSPPDEPGRWNDEGPQHEVTISRGFWMGKYPVTQRQYQQLMGENPSNFTRAGLDAPVERVSWHMATNFTARLQGRLSGDLRGKRAGLPTEAEWEYACRAGTMTVYHTGNGESALRRAGWYSGNSGRTTKPVGEKEANAWGLHDMHGNVWEWCQDGKRTYRASAVTDPGLNDASGSSRVLRGGSWRGDARICRSADRGSGAPGYRNYTVGFRVVVR